MNLICIDRTGGFILSGLRNSLVNMILLTREISSTMNNWFLNNAWFPSTALSVTRISAQICRHIASNMFKNQGFLILRISTSELAEVSLLKDMYYERMSWYGVELWRVCFTLARKVRNLGYQCLHALWILMSGVESCLKCHPKARLVAISTCFVSIRVRMVCFSNETLLFRLVSQLFFATVCFVQIRGTL